MARPKSDKITKPVMVRMEPELIDQLDAARRDIDDLPTRPELIRRICLEWLGAKENR